MATTSSLGDGAAPFVLTLEMDGESLSRFNGLRRRHNPTERLLTPAHVTLFHRLPGGHACEISALLTKVASERKAFAISVGDVKEMERGVAVFLHSPQLTVLRETLAEEWWPWLTDQDRLGFRPHMTIVNNIAAGARRIRQQVQAEFHAPHMQGIGLHLWRYREGPWEDAQLFRFQ